MVTAQVTELEMRQLEQFFEGASLGSVLSTARSRRVGLGYSVEPGVEQKHPATGRILHQEKGPLAFVSGKEPVLLTEVEEAITCWAACGPNGIIAWDLPLHGGFNELTHLAGRTIPSAANSLATDMLIINDRGTFIYKAGRDRAKPIEIESEDDYGKVLQWYRESLTRISDTRPDIDWATKLEGTPDGSIFGPWQYNVNRPGSTWFIPLQDIGWLYLSVRPIIFEWFATYMVDDLTGEPAGLKKWVDEGLLKVPASISASEQGIFQAETYPVGCMVQNIRLAAEALGLGSWVFCGYSDDALMAGVPGIASGLGFHAEPPASTYQARCHPTAIGAAMMDNSSRSQRLLTSCDGCLSGLQRALASKRSALASRRRAYRHQMLDTTVADAMAGVTSRSTTS